MSETVNEWRVGDNVGYTLLQKREGQWENLDNCDFRTIGQAVGLLRSLERNDPGATFAVARLALAVLSRPDGAAS